MIIYFMKGIITMKILVVNAGSSSLKYQLIEMTDEKVIAKGNCERIGIDGHIKHTAFDGRVYESDCTFPTHTEAFEKVVEVLTTGNAAVIKSMDEISAVGHRIVQGAEVFNKTTLVTDEVIQKIDDLAELAPVHNHPHALALWACKKVIPETVPQAVVFDTAFHQTMPEKAFMFGMPYECYEKYHVRKYGFQSSARISRTSRSFPATSVTAPPSQLLTAVSLLIHPWASLPLTVLSWAHVPVVLTLPQLHS